MAVHRLLVPNRLHASGVALTASSALATLPVVYLLDQMRSKVWRSKTGWTIVSGFNDKIDFNRGGVKVATIAAGTYAAAADLCAAIVTALEAADSTPVWACTYSGSTFKFTVSSDIAFTLLLNTGANVATAVSVDLGFSTAADTASATSHTAGSAAYQSRHYVKADLGSALSLQAGVALNHNVSAGGSITFQANATDAWAAPTVNQALNVTMDELVQSPAGRLAFIGTQTLRWVRFLFNDVGNSAGYNEAGVLFAGPYVQPTYMFSINHAKTRSDLSQLLDAVGGAHYRNAKSTKRRFGLEWADFPDADRQVLEDAFDQLPKGKNFFFALDATGTPARTIYGYIESDVVVPVTSGDYYSPAATFSEALP